MYMGSVPLPVAVNGIDPIYIVVFLQDVIFSSRRSGRLLIFTVQMLGIARRSTRDSRLKMSGSLNLQLPL